MNKEILKEVILSQKNSLWYVKNFISREKLEDIDNYINSPFVIIISGIRRSGKSVLLEYIKDKIGWNYYINFDDIKLHNFSLDDFIILDELFVELFWNQNTYYFDEIQLISGWEKYVRTLHNNWKKIFITWSNASMLSRELWTHLTWRNIQIELYPFSFREFLKFNDFILEKNDIYLIEKKSKIKNLFEDYLNKWWFPLYLQNQNKEVFKNLYENIVYKDVIVRYGIKDEKIIKDLLYYINSNIAKEVSYTKLKNILWLSNANTVKEYINYFENSYLLFAINKFDFSIKKQLLNPKKIYSIDVWFSSSVSFEFSKNNWQKLENLVFLELKRKWYDIYYHKVKKECDFLLRDRGTIIWAIQVSYNLYEEETKKREIDWLLEALKIYNLPEWFILTSTSVILNGGIALKTLSVGWAILQLRINSGKLRLQKDLSCSELSLKWQHSKITQALISN